MHLIDLDAFFERIGHTGSRQPDLDTLRALHHAAAMTFVFENLNNWTGRPVSLDLEAIEEKFVRAGRGGYCFEANTLFAAVLGQLGYDVTPLIGWVQWMQPPGTPPTRCHMLLLVKIDGRSWIVDVGFGGIGQTAPLAFETGIRQTTGSESRRYVLRDGVHTLQFEVAPDQWEDVYSFDLRTVVPMDFVIANWYISTHPDSLFNKTLLVTATRPDQRLVIAFGEFTIRHPDGRADKRMIADDQDLNELLTGTFGLPAADPAVREARLGGLAAARQLASLI